MTDVTGEQSSRQESNLPGKYEGLSQLHLEQDENDYVSGLSKCPSFGKAALDCARALAKTIADWATT
jgi:hypothetical protein